MNKEQKLFFEGVDGQLFKEEIKKFSSFEEFEKMYDLDSFVDTADVAKMGLIKISDTNWYPTKLLVEYSKDPTEQFLAFVQEIKDGKPIPPIVVEESQLSEIDENGKIVSEGKKKSGFFLRDGIHRLSAYEHAGFEYIPAIIYETAHPDAIREFDNTISMKHLLGIDLMEIYANAGGITSSIQSVDEAAELLDNFFSKFPNKILGEEYETVNAFNRPITKVKGNLESALAEIKVEAVEIDENASEEALDNTIEAETYDFTEEEQSNIGKVLEQASSENLSANDDVQTFEETLTRYNTEISEDELTAWIWYQRMNSHYIDEEAILKKSNGWSKYVIPISTENKEIDRWLKEGIVCFSKGKFVPSVLYYSGNIYEKQSYLLRDRTTIIERFGKEYYDLQWERLEEVKPKRLTLTDEIVDNRLSIKPISDLAKEFIIEELRDGTRFTERSLATRTQESVKKSLFGAFIIWLRALPKDTFKRSNPYEIEYYYLKNQSVARRYDKAEKLRIKENSKSEGENLFVEFLAEAINAEDQQKIEQLWNSRFNGFVPVNYFKVPIAFECSNTFKNKPLFIRPAQREGLGFLAINGSGCIAYDVGVGKTMTGILSIAQALESGMCKRPLIVVPNQTYKNWLAELRGVINRNGKVALSGVLPQYKINDLYNLGESYLNELRDADGNIKAVPEYSISVMTYEGMRRLGFNEETWEKMGMELYHILNQGNDGSNRDRSALYEKVYELMGRGIAGSTVDIEDLGFDFLLQDEAHNMKKIFTAVKGTMTTGSDKRLRSRYQISSGQPSTIGLKGFMLAQYILRSNQNRNVVLLTATPFTNSPLEIFSILGLLGFFRKVDSDLSNLQGFFNHFIKTSMMLTINAKMKPERKEVVLGFNNLIALQQLIFRFIDYKTGEEADIQRPQKWVLPLTHKVDGDEVIPLATEDQISTNLPQTAKQKELMAKLQDYIMGEANYEDFCNNPSGIEEDEEEGSKGEVLSEANMDEEELEGARILRGISLARQIAFSPYLFSCYRQDQKEITYESFVASSPKLQYVMGCIRTIKAHHENRKEEMSGQVIYANAGVSYFPLIAEYLVQRLGFKSSEIGIIRGGMSSKQKEAVKDKFLDGRVKILLGSKAIKEGINLQARASVLYNLWLDWNPTDLKQLEGRIWRYGNQFANVRIVLPLMEDSIDTAIFQKLEEKTSRINEIWHRSGTENSLKLENFNPAELKMGLITNPNVLAEITLMEEREILRDEIARLFSQKEELEEISSAKSSFDRNFPKIELKVEQERPLKKDQEKRKTETVLRVFRDLVDDTEVHTSYADEVSYDEVRDAYRVLKNALERILEPRGLTIDFNKEDVVGQIEAEIEVIREKMDSRTGEEAVQKLGKEILKERLANGYKPKSVEDRVKEFATLNDHLLGEMMVYAGQDPVKQLKVSTDVDDPQLIEMREILEEVKRVEELMKEMEKLSKAA